jgi:hypothetical protein
MVSSELLEAAAGTRSEPEARADIEANRVKELLLTIGLIESGWYLNVWRWRSPRMKDDGRIAIDQFGTIYDAREDAWESPFDTGAREGRYLGTFFITPNGNVSALDLSPTQCEIDAREEDRAACRRAGTSSRAL